ncbi:NUDIX hydrolase [Gordonia shandongensis]|uniref:NUDIX hydrolase n=1 Tax=Gordonia shandongensis TaxID=376351 RepID=UPI0003F5AEAA|nr:NUDIX hydrolase [Gordonia shandongensis]
MTISTAVGGALGVVAVIALVWVGVLAATRATRLDRLNVRVDLAGVALFAALERRAVVGRALAAADPDADGAGELIRAADAAETADRREREACENRLSVALSRIDTGQLPPALVAELADAQVRITMARRFYNDAVRDARTLGSRRMVRWLRLGGHSRLPEYFEITERVSGHRP